jgi:predicted enzyme related to lactoylglutathione lyase
LRERSPRAGLPQDVEARRRWTRGEAFNPGCKSMPDGFQEIGWIQRRVADVAKMSEFYRTVVGLADLGTENDRRLFDLGDNVILELIPGGTVMPAPADRKEADALIIMRVDHIEKYRGHLEAHGTKIINRKIDVYWGEVAYFVDPEGHAPEKSALTEGLEAERRWREKMGRERQA